jgi:primosomal protein N' (replication factor Y)
MRFADVILPLNLPQMLTYGVPEHLQGTLQAGMRVEVSLGNNKQYAGIIDTLHNRKPDAYSVKPIKNVLDEHPVVNETQLTFWRWIGQYYMAAPGEVMQAALPAHLKMMAETSLVWCAEPDVLYEWSEAATEAVNALEVRKEITLSDLRGIVGIRFFAQVLNELLEKQAVLINDSLQSAYAPKKEKIVILAAIYEAEEAMAALFKQLERKPKQLALLMAYTELYVKNGFVRRQDLLERTGTTAAQVKSMADKGIFLLEDRNADRLQYTGKQQNVAIVFTPAQEDAYAKLQEGLEEKKVALLHGVTGSGKTLLYIRKIKECLAAGKQALFLLPEIALTTQLVSRLMAHFGEDMGVYHSGFSNNERVEIWEKVRKGDYKVVLGPRSALWLPYNSLGLIIADEEHDGSYKQKDPAPRFHARDAAIYLAGLYHAQVILGSATPSVESLYNVQQAKYAYVALKERYLGVEMPVIELVNAQPAAGVKYGSQMITPPLQQAILEALQQRRQVILFQNRRGYAPFQVCTACGWVPQCKNCAVSLTYHKSTDKMHCHYCGMKASVIHTCAACGSNRLISKSFGTEKIEEEVKQIFPEARVARMDIDSMRGKKSMTDLLNKLEARKIDILVGTQMVVKGLDFAGVSLVGILNADNLLSYPDFRVNERAFQLMEQVSGRAGRTDGAGRVLIQAFNLKHPVLEWVRQHDVHTFYSNEVQYRRQFGYPPFSRLIKIIFKHADEGKAIKGAEVMATALAAFEGIAVQGPGPAIIARVRNMYIMEIWLKCPRDGKALDNIKTFLKAQKQSITSIRGLTNLQILFDVDPV